MNTIENAPRAPRCVLACLTPMLAAHSLADELKPRSARHESILEEVIVTATKRPTPLMEVPFSLHVLSGEEIERRGVRVFRDYLGSIPGVSFSDTGATDVKINIRGVSTDLWSEVRSATAVYLDETPVTPPGATFVSQSPANPNLVDIARIEVLRGPQGTLYGAGSMGGAIRIVTNKPDPSQLRGEVHGALSSTAHGGVNYEIDGVLNLPISDAAALRTVAYYRDADGFIDNLGTGRRNANTDETVGARATGVADLTERLRLSAMLTHQAQQTEGVNMSSVTLDRYQQLTNVPEPYEDEWTLGNVELQYQMDEVELISVTSYVDRGWLAIGDISGFAAFFDAPGVVIADHWQHVREFTQELRASSRSTEQIGWLAGAFYSHRDQVWDMSFPAPGFDAATGGLAAGFGAPDNLGVGHTTFDFETAAAFGELSYRFAPRWSAVVGGRVFRTTETSHVDSVGLLPGGVVDAARQARESGVTPKVSLAFQPDDRSMLFLTAAEGFRPGGPNFTPVPPDLCAAGLASIGLARAPESYDADSLWNYEIGGRYRSDGGRLSISGSVYHIDWSDVQLLAFLSCGTGFIANAGEARSNGLEFELSARVTQNLELGLNAALVDAELTSDVRVLGVRAGDRLPGVPRETAAATVTYAFARWAAGDAFIRGEYQYVGDTEGLFVPEGAPRLSAPAHQLVNVQIGAATREWTAILFANNLLDEYAIVSTVDDGGLSLAGDWYNLKRPRTVGLSIQRRFE